MITKNVVCFFVTSLTVSTVELGFSKKTRLSLVALMIDQLTLKRRFLEENFSPTNLSFQKLQFRSVTPFFVIEIAQNSDIEIAQNQISANFSLRFRRLFYYLAFTSFVLSRTSDLIYWCLVFDTIANFKYSPSCFVKMNFELQIQSRT